MCRKIQFAYNRYFFGLITTEKTAVALRILTAFNKKRHPEERDVVLLRAYCSDDRETPIDELACKVVRELYERAKARRNGASVSLS